jgi:hypothetical protein
MTGNLKLTANPTPLDALQVHTSLHHIRELVGDYTAAPVSSNMSEQHSQTVRVYMPSGPQRGHHMTWSRPDE